MAASSLQHQAANAQARLAGTDTTIAGPVYLAAALPVNVKIPAPMMPPSAKLGL